MSNYTYNVEKQHEKGKLHAIERINALCDKDSFFEIYSAARHQCTNFGMDKKEIPYDGVITGFGKINGKKVAVYAQDFTVQGGSLGKVHGQKIAELINKAIEARCPVIGLNDSDGARIQEGVDALCGYGDIFKQNVREDGYLEGLEDGASQKAMETAENFLKEGISTEIIARCTGLPLEQVKEIAERVLAKA